MNAKKTVYKYPDGCREISGFGDEYEAACRKMVIAGMEWAEGKKLELKFSELKDVFGIIKPGTPDAEQLIKAMTDAVDDCTGAMVHACTNHAYYAIENGWDKYILSMQKPD